MSEPGEFDNNSMVLDSSDKYISRGKLQIVVFVLAVILIPLLCILGSVGNIISLRVFFLQRMRNQTNYMLGALCISDTLFLIHCLIFTCINVYKKANPVAGEALRARAYPAFGAYGSVVTARITSCLITLICVERYVAVFYPMQAKLVCSKKNTVIAIIVIYVLTILVFIPFSLKYEAVEVVMGNTTRVVLNKSEFYLNSVNFYRGYGTFLNILYRFLPLVVIPVLNIRMIRAVHQTWKLRREMSGNRESSSHNNRGNHISDQHRTTIMLVTVTFVFFFCILPGAINSIITHIAPSYSRLGEAKNIYLCVSTVTFLFETINSSINFIIYMAMCRKFRLLYKEVFCCGNGKYYSKISVSSVKDRFKWVSSKKGSNSEQTGSVFRQTVSDCGPVRNKSVSRKPQYNCVHSEGFDVTDREKDTRQTLWILDSKCLTNGEQVSMNSKDGVTGETTVKGNAALHNSLAQKNNGYLPCKKLLSIRKQTRAQDESKQTGKIQNDCHKVSNGHVDKVPPISFCNGMMKTIYSVNQEMPLISENSLSEEEQGPKKSDL